MREENKDDMRDGPVLRGARRRTERGASAVEYGILIAGIAAVIVLAVFAFGDNVSGLFDQGCSAVSTATDGGGDGCGDGDGDQGRQP